MVQWMNQSAYAATAALILHASNHVKHTKNPLTHKHLQMSEKNTHN